MNAQKDIDPIQQARELWPILVRRKWIILLAGVLLSATAIVSICLMPDWYSSTITVQVDPQKIADRYAGPDSVTMDTLRFDTLVQQMLSTVHLRQVIEELQLYPELRACMTPDEVAGYMKKNVTTQVRSGGERNPGTFTITFKSTDAKAVMRVVARLADSFVQWDLATRQHQAEGASDFVADQLAEAKKTLDEQEAKLKQFKTTHLSELPEQLQPNSAALSRLQSGLQANADALNRLDMKKVMLGESHASPENSERARLREDQHKLEQEIVNLRERYSDEYPDVVRANERLTGVRERLANLPEIDPKSARSPGDPRLAALEQEIQAVQSERQKLLAEISRYQAYVEIAPLRDQQFADLSRDYLAAKAHYTSLVEKQYSAGIAVDLEHRREAQRFSILEPATVPQRPIKPNRGRMVMFIVPFCFAFSAGMAVASEKVRGRISTERTLRALLPDSVVIVGRIPRIQTPAYLRRQWLWAGFSITASLLCCTAVAFFIWKVHPHF